MINWYQVAFDKMLSVVFIGCFISILGLNDGANIGHATNSAHRRRANETPRSFTTTASPQCGNRSTSLAFATRIVGGGPSILGEWPWMAALYYAEKGYDGKIKNSTTMTKCGATLISDQWVLTAAHCLPESYERSQLAFVRLGHLDSDGKVRTTSMDVKVKRTVRHPNYINNRITVENDIGLVRLEKKVKFTDYVYPICLLSGPEFTGDRYYHDKNGTVAGWGLTENGSASSVLKHTEVPLEDCQSLLQGKAKLDYRVFCAGDTKNDSCEGDSGGPLMLKGEKTETYYQAGIVSFGRGCAAKNYPGVYTKVAPFITWINVQTGLKF